MNTVYVLGAGASHGELLERRFPEANPHSTPLINGFFDRTLLTDLNYTTAEGDLGQFVEYVRKQNLIEEDFGEGRWKTLDIEQIFTSLEAEREFQNPESNEGAQLTLIRNSLIQYIRRVLGLCTRGARATYYGMLDKKLKNDDTVITFNWDLLLDQALTGTGQFSNQYGNFIHHIIDTPQSNVDRFIRGSGLYLKLHGSLNWFRCGNPKCAANGQVFLTQPVTEFELHAGGPIVCWRCSSQMNPVLIPPLLRKPIVDDSVIRSIWGLAREKLLDAEKVIVIGYSAPVSDFYAAWLLRSTVGRRSEVSVEVVNPCNDKAHRGHSEFRQRMESIFLQKYSDRFTLFSDIAEHL